MVNWLPNSPSTTHFVLLYVAYLTYVTVALIVAPHSYCLNIFSSCTYTVHTSEQHISLAGFVHNLMLLSSCLIRNNSLNDLLGFFRKKKKMEFNTPVGFLVNNKTNKQTKPCSHFSNSHLLFMCCLISQYIMHILHFYRAPLFFFS